MQWMKTRNGRLVLAGGAIAGLILIVAGIWLLGRDDEDDMSFSTTTTTVAPTVPGAPASSLPAEVPSGEEGGQNLEPEPDVIDQPVPETTLPAAQGTTSSTPGREGAEAAAIALVSSRQLVHTGDPFDDPANVCPEERLQVSWSLPQGDFTYGNYVEPLGPAPDGSSTDWVAGIVHCDGSTFQYVGIEAQWDPAAGLWKVIEVPQLFE